MRRVLLALLFAGFACGGKVGPDAEKVATRTAGPPGDSPPASDPVVDASVGPPSFVPTDASAEPPNDPSCPQTKDPAPACAPNRDDGYHCRYLAPADGSDSGTHLCHWTCGCVFLTPESDASWRCVPDLDCDP